MWVETSNTIYGRTSNPYDARRMAGGSSGGEGALLGAAASVVMGGDRVPSLNLDEPVSMRKLRIFYMEGLSDVLLTRPLSKDMRATLRKAVNYFERKYDLVAHRMDIPLARSAIEMFLVSMYIKGGPKLSEYMLCSEGSKGQVNPYLELLKLIMGKSNHTLPGIFGAIIDNTDALSDEQKKEICYKRDRLVREMKELLGSDGIFLFPSWPCTALYHHEPLFSPLNFGYTALFNAIAFPAIECPMGLDKNGLPLGVQIVAAPNSDRILIAAAKDLEEGFGGWVPAGPL
ncbi:hypothetical protein TELCIR_03257 [Teladorsagia circumcincta]|uniref:Amidase domain-containing protein n=1 Tax=Teladorsagia circumcincta TaxID=45464 RepID=A0A2G9UYC8_TELCI|nr:hypothetical protein TELCIR_03257 [Teladorsagia circumcincta]